MYIISHPGGDVASILRTTSNLRETAFDVSFCCFNFTYQKRINPLHKKYAKKKTTTNVDQMYPQDAGKTSENYRY